MFAARGGPTKPINIVNQERTGNGTLSTRPADSCANRYEMADALLDWEALSDYTQATLVAAGLAFQVPAACCTHG